MKKISDSYKIFTKSAAILLIIGLILPSAMQAKQLVDFCMMEMEMSHHEMMDDSHECCILDKSGHETTHKSHHDCEGTQICACSVDITLSKNQFRVPTATTAAVIIPRNGFNFIVNSPDEFIYEDYFAAARQHSPPLYILYDTYLK